MYHERYPDIMFRIEERHREAELGRRLRRSDDAPARRSWLAALVDRLRPTPSASMIAPPRVADRRPTFDADDCPECPAGASGARAA
jgi:hypothetical protein